MKIIYAITSTPDGPIISLNDEAHWLTKHNQVDEIPHTIITQMETAGYEEIDEANFIGINTPELAHADMKSLGFTHSPDFEKWLASL